MFHCLSCCYYLVNLTYFFQGAKNIEHNYSSSLAVLPSKLFIIFAIHIAMFLQFYKQQLLQSILFHHKLKFYCDLRLYLRKCSFSCRGWLEERSKVRILEKLSYICNLFEILLGMFVKRINHRVRSFITSKTCLILKMEMAMTRGGKLPDWCGP